MATKRVIGKVFLIGSILALIIIVACGGTAPPPAAPAQVDTAAIVQQAVEQALANVPTPAPGVRPEDVPSLEDIAAAVLKQVPAGATDEQIRSIAEKAAAGAVTKKELDAAVAAAAKQAAEAAVAAAPTAVPAVESPAAETKPTGTINFSIVELAAPNFVIKNQDFQNFYFLGTTTHEMMFASEVDGSRIPRLVKRMETDSSGLVTTFHLQEGVQFHKGYGEFTADDFLFSINGVIEEGSTHAASGDFRRNYKCDECTLEKVDRYTVKLTRPTPSYQLAWRSWQPDTGLSFNSKLQFDTIGEERANFEAVGTGPWDLVETKTGEFRRMEAVQDHWRKTPEFAEMIWFDISEESTRVANFLVGRLDTALFSAESIQAIRAEPPEGVKYMTLPNTALIRIMITGQQYMTDFAPRLSGEIGNPLGPDAGDCTPVFIACDRDVNSEEWQKALKVRLALNHAIDRQALVNNVAFGDGQPIYMTRWMGHEGRQKQFGLDKLKYEYDVEKAKKLLAEAGYPGGGFEVDMCLVQRPGLAAEAIAAGQAVAAMWAEIGVTANQAIIPHSKFRPTLVSRTARCFYARSDGVRIEPIQYWNAVFSARNPGYNQGLEHPEVQRLIDRANEELDDDTRWGTMAEIAKFFFDNSTDMPLYSKPLVFPMGKRIDPWPIMPRTVDWLNNWEFAKHRAK